MLSRHLSPLLCSVALFAGQARAAVYPMDFPLQYNQREIGQLTASIEGLDLVSMTGNDVLSVLSDLISDPLKAWLTEAGDSQLTLAELKAKGLEFTFNSQDFLIELNLHGSAMATDVLTYGRGDRLTPPSDSATWSMLNNFNLNHQRSNNNTDYASGLEWLMYGNVGGADGINFDGSVFWDTSKGQGSQLYRGELKWYYDQPELPLRITFGDTQSRSLGHLATYSVGGFSFDSAYSQLQPQRNTTPGNSQEFVLSRTANVDVLVNGFLVSRVRLRPGRYDINDLPMASGSNNVEVQATYGDGEIETFEFTTYYNAQLLSAGLSDYSIAVGFPTRIDNNVYHYADKPLLSGVYEYGMHDALTIGVNGALHQDGQVAGATATLGYPWGNLSIRTSMSKADGQTGEAFTIESEHSVWGKSQYGSPNLRLGLDKRREFRSSPWQPTDAANSVERVFFDYSYYFDENIDFNTNGSVQWDKDRNRREDFVAQLSWRRQGLNISAGYRRGGTLLRDDQDNNRLFVNFSWSFFDLATSSRSRVRHTSQTKLTSASYAKVNQNYMDDYGYEVIAEKGEDYRREQLAASYTGRLARGAINVDEFNRDGQGGSVGLGIDLSTSIGIADGKVGMGANVTAPFAVVDKHGSLQGSEVLVNVNRFNQAQTMAGDSLGALVSLGSGFAESRFTIDVPDAPLGYDWGPGTYQMAGGANTGHVVQVGSDLSYTVMGVLLDDNGEPVSLQRGIVERLDAEGAPLNLNFFTNRTGRFVVEGIGAGEYRVRLGERAGRLVIVESQQRFVNVGTVTLSEQLRGNH